MKRSHFLQGLAALGPLAGVTGCLAPGVSVYPPTPTPIPPDSGGSVPPPSAPAPFRLGFERLGENGFDLLQGQRVGLVCNQASVTRYGTQVRTILQRDPRVNLTALYSPEHGIDGKALAGQYVASGRDSLTGLAVHSLYAATRKPSSQQLSMIDVLVFDLQDLGVRSYTYMSTLFRCMEACAEQGKTFVVLDRPNPLGGLRVEGPPLEARWTSFVGNAPVPYVHGMTSGELAALFHGARMVNRPRLHVVPMTGWRRSQIWTDTKLRWIKTSPNIPRPISAFHYVATGMLGGASGVDVGIGTSEPFAYAGGDGVDGRSLAYAMRARRIPGVRFSPYRSSLREGHGGVKLDVDPKTAGDLCALDVILIDEINRRRGGRVLADMGVSTRDLFHKVYGSDRLYNDLRRGVRAEAIIAGWAAPNASFRSLRQPYLLYS